MKRQTPPRDVQFRAGVDLIPAVSRGRRRGDGQHGFRMVFKCLLSIGLVHLSWGCVDQRSVRTSKGVDEAAAARFCADGIVNGNVCCPASCGRCGGPGCSGLPGGADACCTTNIRETGVSCQEGGAPCLIPDDPAEELCAGGILNGDVCCPASCGQCGGTGCGGLPGGADECCTSRIRESNRSCAHFEPPCVMDSGSDGLGAGRTLRSVPSTPRGNLQWRRANLTNYTAYPDPGSEECVEYNGCQWAGMFAALDGRQPESWVRSNNIAAVHSGDFSAYRLKTLRLRANGHEIDVVVYDMCADSDCDGCCTKNSRETGFLIDIESYTAARFGVDDGIVEWACLDCD